MKATDIWFIREASFAGISFFFLLNMLTKQQLVLLSADGPIQFDAFTMYTEFQVISAFDLHSLDMTLQCE